DGWLSPRLTRWRDRWCALQFKIPAGGRLRRAVMLLGGPLTNLALGVVGIYAYVLNFSRFPPETPTTGLGTWPYQAWHDQMVVMGLILGSVSLMLGVVALIPSTAGGVRTPGGQLLDLFRGRSSPSPGLTYLPGTPAASKLLRRVAVGQDLTE